MPDTCVIERTTPEARPTASFAPPFVISAAIITSSHKLVQYRPQSYAVNPTLFFRIPRTYT